MPSSIIHMTVANEVNKILKRDKYKFLIGSIAPDLSKIVGETKEKSHFLDDVVEDIPNIDRFLKKYNSKLDDDFVLGYFIHLYTDYLWTKYFISEIADNKYIKKLDGTIVKLNGNMGIQYIYNDYTNIASKLFDYYDIDLDILTNPLPKIDNIIEEIPMEKINLIVNQTGVYLIQSRDYKEFVFDISNIIQFIDISKDYILAKYNEITKAL